MSPGQDEIDLSDPLVLEVVYRGNQVFLNLNMPENEFF